MTQRPRQRKARCIRDHDLTDPVNIGINASGYRYCIPCNRIVNKEWRERKREEERKHHRGLRYDR